MPEARQGQHMFNTSGSTYTSITRYYKHQKHYKPASRHVCVCVTIIDRCHPGGLLFQHIHQTLTRAAAANGVEAVSTDTIVETSATA